jgi:regulator of RNase E activity RraA
MTDVSRQVLDKLRTFDTPTICNVIELFAIRPRNTGYLDARIKACYPDLPPIVGFAATATFRAASPPVTGNIGASMEKQVERFGELSGPPVVVFQDLDDPALAATFGEIMCSVYQAFGAVGLVTSGAGRDLAQVQALHFPVFTNGSIGSHGYCHIPDIHVPVRVGGAVIYPDDLLHGDLNGVTTIPRDIAANVADAADEYVAAEAITLNAVRQTGVSLSRWREARREQLARIDTLRRRVARQAT